MKGLKLKDCRPVHNLILNFGLTCIVTLKEKNAETKIIAEPHFNKNSI